MIGSGVARAMTTGLGEVSSISLQTLVIAMAAATLWSLLCWWLGIRRLRRTLIGGLVGRRGWYTAPMPSLGTGSCGGGALLAAPFVGFRVGFVLMALLLLVSAGRRRESTCSSDACRL
jgi:hypothetical protein